MHHSDRGTQYLSIRYTERLAAAGIELSVGSRGDAYDNALAETGIGLFKTVRSFDAADRGGAWRRWNSPRSRGSIGSIRGGYLNRLATYPQRNLKRRIISKRRERRSTNSPSGIPGTIHNRSVAASCLEPTTKR